jgi:hypothetical protein
MSLSFAPLSLPALTLQLRPLPSAVVTRFIGTMGRSDSHPGPVSPSRAPELAAAAAATDGSPVLRCVFLADVPSPLPRRTRRTGLFGAFDGPLHQRRRRPSPSVRGVGVHLVLFRGLLGVHCYYGPSAC